MYDLPHTLPFLIDDVWAKDNAEYHIIGTSILLRLFLFINGYSLPEETM